MHPIAVAAHGVDFAVVDDIAVGMGALPAGKGIGRKARVHQRQRRFEALVQQIGIIRLDLRRDKHALVDDGARRKAGGIIRGHLAAVADGVGRAFADDVEHALKIEWIGADALAAPDKDLAYNGLAFEGRIAELAVVDGHVAPAQERLSFFFYNTRQRFLADGARFFIARDKEHTDAVGTGLGQFKVADGGEKFVRYLHENTGAVPRIGFAATGAAMFEVDQDL